MRKFKTSAAVAVSLIACVLFSAVPILRAQQTPVPRYKNTALSFEQRAEDLLARMTLEEKVSQMMNAAAPVERLGIPAYEWWNEALHGVARAGIATVFPQAIGLAATWNDSLVREVADVVSTEARAKHEEFVRHDERGRYKGLTFWSPNINIFRDPRWGRGQETYGEDPFLTAQMGVAYVRGLQGDDPKYLKVAATVKHYAVHSGPEPERHSFDARADERDLRETYLPAFRATIRDAHAAGVMCAYNRTNGEPACANNKLLGEILRGEWGFRGHVVSDCAAIEDIYKGHKFVKTEAEASALAVRRGTDLTCGKEYNSLLQAVREGLITEREIDAALKNLLLIRFRLGMFDPPEMVRYARIPYSENDSPAHRALALRAARESVVLLKNQNETLPLSKSLKTIAVIGPNADAPDVLLGNYNGQPSNSVTPLAGIKNKVSPETKVTYSPGMYPTGVTFESIAATALTHGDDNAQGLRAEYFNNRDFQGAPALVRDDAQIDFNWGSVSPDAAVVPDNFSVRWTGKLTAPESGAYQFGLRGNGAIRIYLDDKLVVEENKNPRTRNVLETLNFVAGKTYKLRVEYQENANHYAQARMVWSPPGAQAHLREEALSQARQADAVVMVMGISPIVEGEEMDVKLAGFRGGDRTDIALPAPQEELLKAVHALGKPVILVLMGGSALAINWADKNLSAILDIWYPGEEGGTALADVLFGDYNPAGRLPVTFYQSVAQLPPFEDYKMQGRTYRYFAGEPLYPFGYGLSYTQFAYSKLQMKKSIRAGENLTISVEIKNTGKTAGDEVAQVYLTDIQATVPVALRSLVGFTRVHLQPGEQRTLSFQITPRQMSVIDNGGRRVIEPGDFSSSVGSSQPDVKRQTANVTGRFSVTGKTLLLRENEN